YFLILLEGEAGIRDPLVTGVQTCALPISSGDHVAHDALLDVGGDEARAVHRLDDDGAPELDRLHVPEGASVLANGSAAGARENRSEERRVGADAGGPSAQAGGGRRVQRDR